MSRSDSENEGWVWSVTEPPTEERVAEGTVRIKAAHYEAFKRVGPGLVEFSADSQERLEQIIGDYEREYASKTQLPSLEDRIATQQKVQELREETVTVGDSTDEEVKEAEKLSKVASEINQADEEKGSHAPAAGVIAGVISTPVTAPTAVEAARTGRGTTPASKEEK